MRSKMASAAALALVAGSAPALAAPCKDGKTGKFVIGSTSPRSRRSAARRVRSRSNEVWCRLSFCECSPQVLWRTS